MESVGINLYSDTQTRPTAAMREAIATAPVGDEQRFEDPSVNRLCEMVSERLGTEAAVFLPSGTMCNEIAILVHCNPGDEIIADRTAHVINFEGGGPAAFAGAPIYPLDGVRGVFGPDQVEGALRGPDRYSPTSRLLVVEQTSNMGGGTVWPMDRIDAVVDVAVGAELATHMDGARLFNAEVASGIPAARHAAGFDSVWIDLSKGLGCPMGGVLAGSADFIEEAWRWKQRIGGALRQAGIAAAAGVFALEHHIDRLAEDHANARRFAELVADIDGIGVDLDTVETNMVFFDVGGTGRTADEVTAAAADQGVLVGAVSETSIRAVTHLDVTREDIESAAAAFRDVVV